MHNIEAYPTNTKGTLSYLIAYKETPLVKDNLATLGQQFVEAAEEFNAFTQLMDEAVQRYWKENLRVSE